MTNLEHLKVLIDDILSEREFADCEFADEVVRNILLFHADNFDKGDVFDVLDFTICDFLDWLDEEYSPSGDEE